MDIHSLSKHKAERLRQQRRVAKKRWRQNHREADKLSLKNWVKRNPERVKAIRINSYHRRKPFKLEDNRRQRSERYHRKRSNGYENCSDRLRELSKEKLCTWCGGLLSELGFNIDHIVPIVRGGKHVPDNLVASCEKCNKSKGSKLVEDWLPSYLTA